MSSYRLEPPQCQHIKDNGLRCGSPALRGQAFCYHHQRIHHPRFRPGQKGYIVPALETPEAVTLAFRQIAQAAHDGTLALPVARLMLNAVRWAGASVRKHSTIASEVVTEIPPAMSAVTNVSVTADTTVRPDVVDPIDRVRAAALGCAETAAPAATDSDAATPADISDPIINNQSPINNPSDDQIRESIFHPNPDAVHTYWTQHLPPEVANLRGTDGELFYQPPTWLPLTPEQLAYLSAHQPDDKANCTPEEYQNYERLTLHITHCSVHPPHPESILKNYRDIQAGDALINKLFSTIKKSPERAVKMLNDSLEAAAAKEESA